MQQGRHTAPRAQWPAGAAHLPSSRGCAPFHHGAPLTSLLDNERSFSLDLLTWDSPLSPARLPLNCTSRSLSCPGLFHKALSKGLSLTLTNIATLRNPVSLDTCLLALVPLDYSCCTEVAPRVSVVFLELMVHSCHVQKADEHCKVDAIM